jgi:hypothetical protein
MLDLFAGLGGASQAMRERGWEVIRVELDPRFEPEVVADITTWRWRGRRPDLIWASPPCTEYARMAMPWTRAKLPEGFCPDPTLVKAAIRIIRDSRPRYWVIENVGGAVRYLRPLLGDPTVVGPLRLWGRWPDSIRWPTLPKKIKQRYPGYRPDLRAMIPYEVSLALAKAIEGER